MKILRISKSIALLSVSMLCAQQVYAQKTLMDIDIQGVKIGMSPSQATSIVEQLSQKVGSRVTVKSVQLGGSDPATGRVAAIYRRIPFKAGARPLSANISNDILEKYGKPIYETHNREDFRVWAFDTKGDPLKTWAGNKCLLGFPRPESGDVMTDPTYPTVHWAEIIEKYWQEHNVAAYYKSCGSKLLTIQLLNEPGINTTYLANFIFLDIQGVIEGNAKANALMNAVSQESKKEAIKNANVIKPTL